MQTSVRPLLLNSREAAQLLSLSERKLWDLMATGEIPHLKVGRSVRYAIEDLKSWIESNKVTTRESIKKAV